MNASAVATSDPPLLEALGLTKRFPGVVALSGVHLTLRPGEIVAVIGENGAGKSTLMKILAGIQTPDSGELKVDGKSANLDSVPAAMSYGVALIHQELNLADNLDIASNIFLGREPTRFGLVDRRRMEREAERLLASVSLRVSPRTIVSTLSTGQQQLVEIAKALSINARVLIMDEPTSSLSQHETESLYRVVRELRFQGVAIVYISHRLGEVKELADRVVVLRDGENAGELKREEIDHERMVRMMVGREISQFYARKPHTPGDVVLETKGLVTPKWPNHAINVSLRAGEIVGIAGLVGAGRTEFLRVLFGVERPLAGSIHVGGKEVEFASPVEAIAAGIALVPEDRKHQGLVLDFSVRTNVGLPGLSRHSRAGIFVNDDAERRDCDAMVESLRIKTPSRDQIVQLLSGGNQQKVVIGKWLSLGPRILLLDEPTRGIDVGAKQEIYRLMEQLAKSGVAILFASSEMEEILGMSDRTLVMHEGAIRGELPREKLTEENVMRLATGGNSGFRIQGGGNTEFRADRHLTTLDSYHADP